MTRSTRYPGADRTRFYGGGGYSGIDQLRLEKIVLHSTETSPKWGCPGYGGGAMAPTFTIDPWSGKVWQHFDTNESARALLNPSSTPVSENRDGVCQIEIIGYSDAKIAKTYGSDLRDLTDAGYAHIAKLVKWIAVEWDVPLTFPKEWPAYPASYGNTSARMTSSEYDRFSGVLAHLHVSGNSHGDVTIDVGRLKAALGTATTVSKPTAVAKPKPVSSAKAPAFPLPRGHWYGVESSDKRNHSGYYAKDRAGIKQWQAQMKKRGWAIGVDGIFGAQSEKVAKAFQRQERISPDGAVGAVTWAKSWTADIT